MLKRDLDRQALESVIMDVKGDRLLLSLAIDAIEDAATASRQARGPDDDPATLTVSLCEDELTALAHAHVNLLRRVKDRSRNGLLWRAAAMSALVHHARRRAASLPADRRTRARIVDVIERLIAMLDVIDGDPDLEPDDEGDELDLGEHDEAQLVDRWNAKFG